MTPSCDRVRELVCGLLLCIALLRYVIAGQGVAPILAFLRPLGKKPLRDPLRGVHAQVYFFLVAGGGALQFAVADGCG